MRPIDKFGNEIYPKIFFILRKIGRKLESIGYSEKNEEKPNMFSRQVMDIVFYMDMRGTEEVPIWMEPCPMFYCHTYGRKKRPPSRSKTGGLKPGSVPGFDDGGIPSPRFVIEDRVDLALEILEVVDGKDAALGEVFHVGGRLLEAEEDLVSRERVEEQARDLLDRAPLSTDIEHPFEPFGVYLLDLLDPREGLLHDPLMPPESHVETGKGLDLLQRCQVMAEPGVGGDRLGRLVR